MLAYQSQDVLDTPRQAQAEGMEMMSATERIAWFNMAPAFTNRLSFRYDSKSEGPNSGGAWECPEATEQEG